MFIAAKKTINLSKGLMRNFALFILNYNLIYS